MENPQHHYQCQLSKRKKTKIVKAGPSVHVVQNEVARYVTSVPQGDIGSDKFEEHQNHDSDQRNKGTQEETETFEQG